MKQIVTAIALIVLFGTVTLAGQLNNPASVDVNGSGAANRIAYWTDADTLSSNASAFFDGTTLAPDTICLDATNRDACLVRAAANRMALRNGTTAQRFDVTNSYTDDTTFEAISLRWASNEGLIETAGSPGRPLRINSGSGNLRFEVASVGAWQMSATALLPDVGAGGDLGSTAKALKRIYFDYINTAVGTTGNQTINTVSGRVNIAAAGTSVVVTNNLVTAASQCFAIMVTNDTTGRVTACVTAAGSFTIYTVAVNAEAAFAYQVFNTN